MIRLRYMVKVPFHRRTALSRRAVFARDDYRCQYCGRTADSIDHVMPRSRGGEHIWENVAAACRPCNLAKRDRTPDEAGMRLARPCRAPRRRPGSSSAYTRARGVEAVPGASRPDGRRVRHPGRHDAYAVETFTGSAADFHARDIGDEPAPAVWAFDVAAPALVLGSKQRGAGIADEAACAAAGVEVVRRRSGGGAVLLVPGEVVWFDVVVPAAQLHAAGVGDDVTASMSWLGWRVATALPTSGSRRTCTAARCRARRGAR